MEMCSGLYILKKKRRAALKTHNYISGAVRKERVILVSTWNAESRYQCSSSFSSKKMTDTTTFKLSGTDKVEYIRQEYFYNVDRYHILLQ